MQARHKTVACIFYLASRLAQRLHYRLYLAWGPHALALSVAKLREPLRKSRRHAYPFLQLAPRAAWR